MREHKTGSQLVSQRDIVIQWTEWLLLLVLEKPNNVQKHVRDIFFEYS